VHIDDLRLNDHQQLAEQIPMHCVEQEFIQAKFHVFQKISH